MDKPNIDTWYLTMLRLIAKGQWQEVVKQLASPVSEPEIEAPSSDKPLNMSSILSAIAHNKRQAGLPQSLQSLIDQWQEAYRTMQDLMLTSQLGQENDSYDALRRQLLYITTLVARHHRLQRGLSIYAMCHSESHRHKDDANHVGLIDELVLQMADCAEHDEHYFALLDSLFNSVFTAAPLRDDDERVATEALIGSFDPLPMAYITTALTLSCYTFFCPHKFVILCHLACGDTPVDVKARALVGVVMIYNRFNRIAELSPSCRDAISQVLESGLPTLCSMYEQWIITSNTSDMQHTIEGRIMPLLMKSANVHTDTFQGEGHQTHIIKIDTSDPSNFKNRDQRDAFMRFIRLMKAGADTNYATFMAMKRFDFFMSLGHWLLPFSVEYPSVHRVIRNIDPEMVAHISAGTGMCSSDLYSMSSMLNLTSGISRDNILQTLSGKILSSDDLDDEEQHEAMQDFLREQLTIERFMRSYLQDLYRLFTLHPAREEMENPFTHANKGLAMAPFWRLLMGESTFLLRAARFYTDMEKHTEAIEMYRRYLKLIPDDVEAMIELADCYVNSEALRPAVEYLKRAILAGGDEQLCLRKQAAILMRARSYSSLLQVLDRLIELNPDDLQLQSTKALTLMHNRMFYEACSQYQAVALTTNDAELRSTANRGAAWCMFCMHQYEDALRAYDGFIDNGELHPEDLLNRGHVLWGMGRVSEAADSYLSHLRLMASEKRGGDKHIDMFDEDIQELIITTGVTPQQVAIMRDYILQQTCDE